MINVITYLSVEQRQMVKHELYSLNNICVCERCNALIQFDDININREKTLPHVRCSCGNSIQLHSKYYK